ncbi:hypothetical protein HPULCUR_010763 [Helicostylum pulchrum]|uniref:Uncharacterized protein n=1 Tax=Helicostylum pulchrum TaxID=562976 RepID=A0ABP9YE70_9FUNG
MVDTKPRNTTLKKLARWNPSSPSSAGMSSIPPLSSDAPFTHVHHEQLQQGGLYIIKIKQVSVAMFEGWNDDMCCFSILRSEVEPLRWSDARQLPGDFDIYDAFDECGNPPIHLWSKNLKVLVPRNWFCMFEEAKRRQRDWHMRQQQQQQQQLIRRSMVQEHDQNGYYYPPVPEQDPSTTVTTTTTAINDSHTDAVYSNTDVSSMSLNHQGSTTESLMAPSVVASTNIIDPIMMSQEHTSNLRYQPSVTSTSTTNVTRSRVLSSAPSYRENSSVERSGSIMDREQIRRHLAPGQAKITTRSSGSVVTLASTVTSLSPLNKSPTLIHHRSKELVHGIPEEQSKDEIKTESNISALSDEVDFPHDSDRFSIRSDISAVNSPSLKPSVSSKSRNRASVKKIIWG